MATRIGVDVGGTFTDLVFYDDESGEVLVSKGSTTPDAPDRGVAGVVSSALPRPAIRSAAYFLHGTTVGINALLERNGAVVGLLTTRGFRDVLETRRGDREAMYDMLWKPPPPLVPRRFRLSVSERIRADGTIELPLNLADVEQALETFAEHQVESVAIVFINSYTNPEHELQAERHLRACGFRGEISLSHSVSGEYREYERSSTTVIDAYVRPRVSQYLRRLEAAVDERGFGGEFLITRSGGGAMLFPEAEARPFETIMSGPVAGAMGTSELCRSLGISEAITADVGGTSFDTCLIVDGRPQVKYEGKIDGMPLQTPWVDVRSIGAGGGSIAYVDHGGLLRVGPQSAGARPGPACYGRGGDKATVTDAAAVLGMFAKGELAGGVRLDKDASWRALEPLANQLALDLDEVACGILRIANAAMADAIRSVTVEQGQDPRGSSLIAFGGAGPLFATLLARELGIRQIVVPNYAGNFSAWGLLGQDITRSAARTLIRRLDSEGIAAANTALRLLYERLHSRSSNDADVARLLEPALDLRYVGQEYTLTIRPAAGEDGLISASAETVSQSFTEDYERTFGHLLAEPIEVVSVRGVARRPLPRKTKEWAPHKSEPGAVESVFEAHSFTRERRMPFATVQRGSLTPGATLAGPAIVLEETCTTYVDAGFELSLDLSGCLFLHDREVDGDA